MLAVIYHFSKQERNVLVNVVNKITFTEMTYYKSVIHRIDSLVPVPVVLDLLKMAYVLAT